MDRQKCLRRRSGPVHWAYLAFLFGLLVPNWRLQAAGPDVQGTTSPVAAASETKAFTVDLVEVPVFEVDQRIQSRFASGVAVVCQPNRASNVEYPVFSSTKPLFGAVRFADRPSQLVGMMAGESRTGAHFFAIDDRNKSAPGYDTLYFDCDADLDLARETPVQVQTAPPAGAIIRPTNTMRETWFGAVEVTFNLGTDGTQTVQLLPRMMVPQNGTAVMYFIPAKVHKGDLDIAGTKYTAYLGYRQLITGRLDQPPAQLLLTQDKAALVSSLGGDEPAATHLIAGTYYRFAATARGDKLTISPCDGPLGVFELGAGGRKIERLEMQGSLRTDKTVLPVAESSGKSLLKPTRSCRIPVGDYYPQTLVLSLDQLQVMVSNNTYRVDSQGSASGGKTPTFGVHIREDKPFVLDFSGKPQVLFVSPGARQRIRLGETASIRAILVDPTLDIMIRRLAVVQSPLRRTTAAGVVVASAAQPATVLNPKAVIARSDGQIVAEGPMPFG